MLVSCESVEGHFYKSALLPLCESHGPLVHSAKGKANSILDDLVKAPPSMTGCKHTMRDVCINQTAMRRALSSSDVRMYSGCDGIPAIVLETCAPE